MRRRGRGTGARALAILAFIALVVALNVLSAKLDWGFYFY